jgi:hypothetical protein
MSYHNSPSTIERGITDSFLIRPASAAAGLARDRSGRFDFRAPAHWKSPVDRNPHALAAQRDKLDWFVSLGCSAAEMRRAERFDIAGYVGIPFPFLPCDKAARIGKYVSMWLLWDDVHVENLESRWRIGTEHVLADERPPGLTRFDEGWWQLLQELAAARSPRWIDDLCRAMETWSVAAQEEARAKALYSARGIPPSFAREMDLRMATIGMYATVFLLEDAYDFELPGDFLAHPAVSKIMDLSNMIVGIGNDVLSFCKDCCEGQINLISTLMYERDLVCEDALEQIVRMHNEAVQEYDRLASTLGTWPAEENRWIQRWLQDVRYASIGFSLWEAQAPRYTADKLIVNGRVIEPGFCWG